MNNLDIFELFQNGFTARNTSDSYGRLCNFVSTMRRGQYYPITDEDYNHFIRILSFLPFAKKDVGDSCQRHNCTIYAWCLTTWNIPEFQLLPHDVQDMAVRAVLDAGASVRQAVSHTVLSTKQIRKRYDR